jgi:serine/threonine-protein kinase RsbW
LSQINNTFYKELSVKSTTDHLAQIREFTKRAANECGFSDDVIGKIILAVDEACTNIIKHAYKYSPDGNITIAIKFAESKFEIAIIDEGIHFNPDSIPEPDIKEYYKQKKVGGLGVYLIRKLMDEVKYSTSTGNKNQVVLVKYLSR